MYDSVTCMNGLTSHVPRPTSGILPPLRSVTNGIVAGFMTTNQLLIRCDGKEPREAVDVRH